MEEQEDVHAAGNAHLGVTSVCGDRSGVRQRSTEAALEQPAGSRSRQTWESFQPSLALPLHCAFPSAGILLFLSLALLVFTRESHCCLPQLAQTHGVLMLTLKRLLSPGFLACLAQT